MTDRDDISEIVEIDFEVGHISTIRAEPTTNHHPPRTHDWKVYLRSADVHGDLSCLIQRCVFTLHPEFPQHKRELKSTPFAIQESGYAGFHLPIEIYFKTKKEPKKFRIDYDLDLHTNIEGYPNRQKESYVRKYRCTFCDPDPDLRQKILAAGGKIKDTSTITTNTHDTDKNDVEEKHIPALPPSLPPPPPPPPPPSPTARHSPPQKRPFSPIPAINPANNKKIKVEQSVINPKKKQPQQSIIKNENSNKITVNTINTTKKSQLIPSQKASAIVEDKVTKNVPIKDSNITVSSTSNISGPSEDPTLSKSRLSTKLKSDPDLKPSAPSSTTVITKKKEPVPSPTKMNTPIPLKKPIQMSTNKPSQKIPIKTEQTSTTNKSPTNVNTKRESSPNITSSNSTTSTVLISSLKKIPKKVAPPPPPPPPPIVEKRARSPMTPPPSNRNSDRDFHRHQSSSSKSHSNSKRDRSSTTTTPPSSSINNSGSSRSSSSSNRSGKHGGSSRGRSRTRSRSRSRSRNRSSHQTHHSSRSHHSSNSSRHSSQQKDRSNRHTSPHAHQSSTSKSSSSHHNNRRTPTPSKSTRSPSRSVQTQHEQPPSSNELPTPLVTSSINTPQSRPASVEPPVVASTVCSPSAHVFHSEDDHTQTPMDIDGQSDDDINGHHRPIPLSDEHNQISPSSLTFVPTDSTKLLRNRNFQSDHSYSSLDTNESNDESNLSLDDEDDDLPTVLTNDDLRSKLIYIYNRFTSNSTNDLTIFVTFFKRHHLIDSTSKTTNGMYTYDLFALEPLLIDELASDLGYLTSSLINRTEQ